MRVSGFLKLREFLWQVRNFRYVVYILDSSTQYISEGHGFKSFDSHSPNPDKFNSYVVMTVGGRINLCRNASLSESNRAGKRISHFWEPWWRHTSWSLGTRAHTSLKNILITRYMVASIFDTQRSPAGLLANNIYMNRISTDESLDVVRSCERYSSAGEATWWDCYSFAVYANKLT